MKNMRKLNLIWKSMRTNSLFYNFNQHNYISTNEIYLNKIDEINIKQNQSIAQK